MILKKIFLAVISGAVIIGWISIEEHDEEKYLIRSGSKMVIPVSGEKILSLGLERHLLVQFYKIPDAEKRQKLAKKGITLLGYLDGNAYIASVTAEGDNALQSVSEVRAVLEFDPYMKLSPLLKEQMEKQPDEAGISVVVAFHDDVPYNRALKEIGHAGLICSQSDYHYHHLVKLNLTCIALRHLLSTDMVRWIDVALTPPKPDNAWAASRVRINEVWNRALYDNPKGRDERVGVWDSGKVQIHNDLSGRVRLVEEILEFSEHATHVSGTIASSGKGNKNARGMATHARIYSYDFTGDIMDEMQAAVDEFQLRIANHSWSNIVGWNYSEDKEIWEWWGNRLFGYYHIEASSQDRLVRDSDLLIVRSAGNDRDEAYLGPYEDGFNGQILEDLKPSDPDYRSITPYASGKNIITIGALMKDDAMTGYSNWGPTDDGRIKPDVVATGQRLLSTVRLKAYESKSGTSMSAPVVSGTAALLRGAYKTLLGKDMGSALLKCLLIHSARDLGITGPDYSFGFGLIDAQYAADVIKAKANTKADQSPYSLSVLRSKMIEGQINNAIQRTYQFTVPSGAKELRATLVWHDPEAGHLVNNLNLWLTSPTGKRVNPFTLNPDKPAEPAKRKINKIDNVEHILTKNPAQGKWKIVVKGVKVPMGPQEFALIVSAGDGNSKTEQKTEGKISIRKVYAHGTPDANLHERRQFPHGATAYFKTAFFLPENADWGEFNGSVKIKWTVLQEGKTIFKTNSATSFLYALPEDKLWYWIIGPYIIPAGMDRANYVLKAVVTLHNGISKTKKFNFSVI